MMNPSEQAFMCESNQNHEGEIFWESLHSFYLQASVFIFVKDLIFSCGTIWYGRSAQRIIAWYEMAFLCPVSPPLPLPKGIESYAIYIHDLNPLSYILLWYQSRKEAGWRTFESDSNNLCFSDNMISSGYQMLGIFMVVYLWMHPVTDTTVFCKPWHDIGSLFSQYSASHVSGYL